MPVLFVDAVIGRPFSLIISVTFVLIFVCSEKENKRLKDQFNYKDQQMKRQMHEDRETINEHIKKLSQLNEQIEQMKQNHEKDIKILNEHIS